jgi:hypothetical protein
MRVEYDSNNSGGGWWVKDEGWKALEEAGWHVIWGERTRFKRDASGNIAKDPKTGEILYKDDDWRPKSYAEALKRGQDPKERYLGGLATTARSPEVNDVGEAIRSWEKATGLDASAEGCNCCGPPHRFEVVEWNEETQDWETDWEAGTCSGEGVLSYLFPTSTMRTATLRELMEEESELIEEARNHGEESDV